MPNTANDALGRAARNAARSCSRVYATARETPGIREATSPPYTIMSLETTNARASRGASVAQPARDRIRIARRQIAPEQRPRRLGDAHAGDRAEQPRQLRGDRPVVQRNDDERQGEQ